MAWKERVEEKKTLIFYDRAFMFDKYRISCRHNINKLWHDSSVLVHLLVPHAWAWSTFRGYKGVLPNIADWMLIWYTWRGMSRKGLHWAAWKKIDGWTVNLIVYRRMNLGWRFENENNYYISLETRELLHEIQYFRTIVRSLRHIIATISCVFISTKKQHDNTSII